MAGKPIFGQRVRDVQAWLGWLQRSELMATETLVWAQGVRALEAVFAASLYGHIDGLIMEESLISFESVVQARLPSYGDEILLPAVLCHFDIPVVLQSLAPIPATLINPLLGDGQLASSQDIQLSYQVVEESYSAVGAPQRWSIYAGVDQDERDSLIGNWFSDQWKDP
jgi:hypothetical protein